MADKKSKAALGDSDLDNAMNFEGPVFDADNKDEGFNYNYKIK